MSELIEVLNTEGAPTGTRITRKEAHTTGAWHATVHVYVFRVVDDQIQLLVHLRSTTKDTYPNMWDTVFGGHVQAGKTPLETVSDELYEEAGLLISSEDVISGPTVRAEKGMDKEFNHLFACEVGNNVTITLNDSEVQGVRWMPVSDVATAIQTQKASWRPATQEFSHGLQFLSSIIK